MTIDAMTMGGRSLLAGRSGPLSKRLLAAVEALPHLHPPEVPPS